MGSDQSTRPTMRASHPCCRVLVIMPLAEQRGGAERLLLTLLAASVELPNVSYDVAFLQPGPMIAEVQRLGYTTHLLPAGRVRNAVRTLTTTARLIALLRRLRPDVVMSWMAKGHLYAAPAATVARIPAVWWQHSIPRDGWIDASITHLPAIGIWCCSEAAARAQRALRPHRPTCVIHPGIDVAQFSPDVVPSQAAARKELGLADDRVIVAAFTRLQRWKGVHVLIEAVAQLPSKHRPLAVVCGGPHFSEPRYADDLMADAERLGVRDHVLLAGHQHNVRTWMQAADIIVQPSSLPEPFGIAIVEAMALGKPVVATAHGGPLEILSHGQDGFLVTPDSPVELAHALGHLCRSPATRQIVGARARVRAQAFDQANLARQVEQHIVELCGRPARGLARSATHNSMHA